MDLIGAAGDRPGRDGGEDLGDDAFVGAVGTPEHAVGGVDRPRLRLDAVAVREQAMAAAATGRFTTPEEVATLVALLASPRTGNVTGADFVIDGGLVATV